MQFSLVPKVRLDLKQVIKKRVLEAHRLLLKKKARRARVEAGGAVVEAVLPFNIQVQ